MKRQLSECLLSPHHQPHSVFYLSLLFFFVSSMLIGNFADGSSLLLLFCLCRGDERVEQEEEGGIRRRGREEKEEEEELQGVKYGASRAAYLVSSSVCDFRPCVVVVLKTKRNERNKNYESSIRSCE